MFLCSIYTAFGEIKPDTSDLHFEIFNLQSLFFLRASPQPDKTGDSTPSNFAICNPLFLFEGPLHQVIRGLERRFVFI